MKTYANCAVFLQTAVSQCHRMCTTDVAKGWWKTSGKKPKTYAKWWHFKSICQVDLERPFHGTFALIKSPFSHLHPTPGQSARPTTSFQKPWVGIYVQRLVLKKDLSSYLCGPPCPLSIYALFFSTFTFYFWFNNI